MTGPIRLVSGELVGQVTATLEAVETRPHDGGIMVTYRIPVTVTDGQLSFEAEPGPAVLTIISTAGSQEYADLIIPETSSASLQECMQLGELAAGSEKSELEQLAIRAANAVASATEFAAAAQESAGAAEASASEAAESAGAAEVDRQDVAKAREIIDGYRQEVTTAHGETLMARDAAFEIAQSATYQAGVATQQATIASENAAAAGEFASSAAESAQEATRQADKATEEADRAGEAAEASSVKAVSDRVNELLAGAPEAYDTLLEIAEELERGQTAEAALVKEIAGKAPLDHTHTISQVTGLQSALDGKVASSDVSTVSTANLIPRRNSRGTITSVSPTYSDDLANKGYVDDRTPEVRVVQKMPEDPDPSTVYLVTG